MGWSVKLVYMAEVRTGVHVFAICVKTGIIFKMRSTSFFHVSVPNIYGTSSSTYLIIFLKVISKVLFFNITQKFTNLLVQLSIFLIDLFVGTYRLSSHARLEAFVIQTKLNFPRKPEDMYENNSEARKFSDMTEKNKTKCPLLLCAAFGLHISTTFFKTMIWLHQGWVSQ